MGRETHKHIEARPNPSFWTRVEARAEEEECRQPGFFAYLWKGYFRYALATAPGLIVPNAAGALASLVFLCAIMILPARNERDYVRAAGGEWFWWKFILGQVLGPFIASGVMVGLAYFYGGG